MKICFKCLLTKSIDEFYKHPAMSDGHLNKCKSCTKEDTKSREIILKNTSPDWLEKEKKRHREKYHKLNYKVKHKPNIEKKRRIIETYKNKYPEKIKAKNLSNRIKPKIKGNHLHHWSYKIEHCKDVIEL